MHTDRPGRRRHDIVAGRTHPDRTTMTTERSSSTHDADLKGSRMTMISADQARGGLRRDGRHAWSTSFDLIDFLHDLTEHAAEPSAAPPPPGCCSPTITGGSATWPPRDESAQDARAVPDPGRRRPLPGLLPAPGTAVIDADLTPRPGPLAAPSRPVPSTAGFQSVHAFPHAAARRGHRRAEPVRDQRRTLRRRRGPRRPGARRRRHHRAPPGAHHPPAARCSPSSCRAR